jgi:hypothetical protein
MTTHPRGTLTMTNRLLTAALAALLVALTLGASPAAAARPLPGTPFAFDTVRVLDGSSGNARVRAGVTSWANGTGIGFRWVEPEWAWGIYVRPDHDRQLGALELGGYRMTRDVEGARPWVESCTVLYRPGLSGAQLQTVVARYTGRCLGWTGRVTGRSVLKSEPAPTRRDLSTMRRLYASNLEG